MLQQQTDQAVPHQGMGFPLHKEVRGGQENTAAPGFPVQLSVWTGAQGRAAKATLHEISPDSLAVGPNLPSECSFCFPTEAAQWRGSSAANR